jgi:hypothetical protein
MGGTLVERLAEFAATTELSRLPAGLSTTPSGWCWTRSAVRSEVYAIVREREVRVRAGDGRIGWRRNDLRHRVPDVDLRCWLCQ